MNPLISIITVCYNASTALKTTVLSVLSQDLADCEYIIVDGGSADGTCEYIENVSKEFPLGVLRWRSQKDRGVYDAMNSGVALSSGRWIIFMNAGDVFFNMQTLSEVKKLLSSIVDNDIGVFYGDTLMHYAWADVFQCDNEESNHNPVMPFIHQSAFVRRDLLIWIPFDLSYRIISDYDFFYKLRQRHIRFMHHSIVISKYDATQGLSATSPLQIELERAKILGHDQSFFWPCRKLYILIRSGCVQPLKKMLPATIVNAIMKARRRYMKNINIF